MSEILQNVQFLPWIGRNYQKKPLGKRVLILGESHIYTDFETMKGEKEFTREVIQEIIDGEYTHPFFSKLANLLTNRPNSKLNDAERSSFWNAISFYNYIQDEIPNAARKGPSDQAFKNSVVPFFEVMDELRPELLIVCGMRLWDALPGKWTDDENYYLGKGYKTLSTKIYHPSSGRFTYRGEIDRIGHLLTGKF